MFLSTHTGLSQAVWVRTNWTLHEQWQIECKEGKIGKERWQILENRIIKPTKKKRFFERDSLLEHS